MNFEELQLSIKELLLVRGGQDDPPPPPPPPPCPGPGPGEDD